MKLTIEDVKKIISENESEIRKFGVKEFYLFGSVVRGEAKETSDVDLFVVLDKDARVGLIKFIKLQMYLTDIIGKKVDLATKASLHPSLKEQILKEAIRAA